MYDVSGKTVIITGSAQGFGKEFAERLLAAGASVCISDLNEQLGRKTTLELGEKYSADKVHFVRYELVVLEQNLMP